MKIYGVYGDLKGDFKIPKLERLEEFKYEESFKVRYTDIDSNNHVNNTKYIDWAIETLPEDIVNNYVFRRSKGNF